MHYPARCIQNWAPAKNVLHMACIPNVCIDACMYTQHLGNLNLQLLPTVRNPKDAYHLNF